MAFKNCLFTADLHLTDNAADAYRWEFLIWLEKALQAHRVEYLFVLGDLTDKTDRHSAKLVNNLVSHFQRLANRCRAIFLLKGNHDYVDSELPYFKFLHKALNGKLLYFHRPAEIGLFNRRFLFLPHTRDWAEYRGKYDLAQYTVLIHQPVIGAKGDNGYPITAGLAAKELAGAKKVYAGDIHTPQAVGNIWYTGAPYPVRYGDNYSPSVILETEKGARLLPVPGPKKQIATIACSKQFPPLGYSAGDMVKINVALARADFNRWPIIRRRMAKYCKVHNIKLGGIRLIETGQTPVGTPQGAKTPQNGISGEAKGILKAYGKAKSLPADTLAVGLGIMG